MWYKLSQSKRDEYLKQAINTQYPQESLFFRPWHEDGLIQDDSGQPKPLYHGTLKPFNRFDPDKFSPGAYFGQAVYTTDDPEDASVNYADPTSHDWDAKRSALQDEYDSLEIPDPVSRAREEIVDKAQPNIIPLYGKMKNPAYLQKNIIGHPQVFESGSFDENDEYVEGTGAVVIQELTNVLEDHGIDDADQIVNKIFEEIYEEFTFYDVFKNMRDNLYDYDLNPMEIFQELLERLGHDGIIASANDYFPRIVPNPNTKHYMFFDPKNVKSVFNKTFDPKTDTLNASTSSWYKIATT